MNIISWVLIDIKRAQAYSKTKFIKLNFKGPSPFKCALFKFFSLFHLVASITKHLQTYSSRLYKESPQITSWCTVSSVQICTV